MRKGQNPAKFVKDVAKPERITAAMLTYIPFLSGFYEETLDVLKVSLDSMRNDAGLPFDLLVFDNGSCPEARDYLIQEKEEGRIQYLDSVREERRQRRRLERDPGGRAG